MTFRLLMLFAILVFIRPQEWLVPSLEGIPMLDAIFVLSIAAMAIETNEGQIRWPRRCHQIYLIAGVWIASVMSHISHTYLVGLLTTIPLVGKYTVFSICLIVVLDRPSRLRALVVILVSGGCIMAIHGLLMIHRGYGFAEAEPFWQLNEITGQVFSRTYYFGIFSDPNDMGQWLATALPLVFAIPWRMNFFKLLVCCVVAALLLGGIQTTGSRGTSVAVVTVVATATVMLCFPRKLQPWLMMGIVVGFLLMCTFAGGKMDESAHERVVFWGQANYAFKRNPIFGIGTNMMADYTEDARQVHNSYVLCYTEIGMFGYWFWFGLMQLGLLGVWRARTAIRRPATQEEAWLKRLATAVLCGMSGYAASAYFLGRAFIYPIYLLFALMAAIVVVCERRASQINQPLIKPQRDLYVYNSIGSVLSVFYIYISITFLNKAYFGG
jgi:putative inorganic carbon (hco3(-)) transporter